MRAEEALPTGDFDALHYRRIHHHLFQDVYAWAGEYRTVRTSKGGNPFCYPENITAQMASLFRSLQGGQLFETLDRDAFVDQVTRFLAELNAIHPFREGNGRSQLAFVGLLGATFDQPFYFARLHRERFLGAIIDSYFGRTHMLRDELGALLD